MTIIIIIKIVIIIIVIIKTILINIITYFNVLCNVKQILKRVSILTEK